MSMDLDFKKALILGDVHGDRAFLDLAIKAAKKAECGAVFQLGDFGYWPDYRTYLDDEGAIVMIKKGDTVIGMVEELPYIVSDYDFPVYFVDGNHEHHPSLRQFTDPVTEVKRNLFYVARGTLLQIGRRGVLCLGGAYSIDRLVRVKYESWFPEEVISNADLEAAMNIDSRKVQVILTHDCPFLLQDIRANSIHTEGMANRAQLDALLGRHRPRWWFFGHYHRWYCRTLGLTSTNFVGLPHNKDTKPKALIFDFEKMEPEGTVYLSPE